MVFFFYPLGWCAVADRAVSVVGRSHRCRAAGRCSEQLCSCYRHKQITRQQVDEHDPLARRGQSRPYREGSSTGNRFPEFIWRTHAQISRVHPASRACTSPPSPPDLGPGFSSSSQPRCLQPCWAKQGWLPLVFLPWRKGKRRTPHTIRPLNPAALTPPSHRPLTPTKAAPPAPTGCC